VQVRLPLLLTGRCNGDNQPTVAAFFYLPFQKQSRTPFETESSASA
jgi:hypothetical protein